MTTYEIMRLGHQGDGITEGPLFAPLTLPGEIITGTRDGSRLMDVRIVTPSMDRIRPPCRHFKSCGGCQIQHATDDFVATWKIDVVRKALSAQGMDADFRPIITSPPNSRRRATFSVRRTKKSAMVGFHGRASGVIVEIPDCQLLHIDLIAAMPIIENIAIIAASRKGELSVAVTTSKSGLDIAITDGKDLDGPLEMALGQAVERHAIARLSWNGDLVAQRTPPEQTFGNANVTPPFGAFLQATQSGEAALLKCVMEITQGSQRIADLFAGCGTFSLPLAQHAQIHAVEGDAAMIGALDVGWRRAIGLKHLSCEARDLFRRPLLPDELKKIDAVVIDPPRAGAEAQITELAIAKTPKIAYVSCNPVTFARDAKILVNAGYQIDWLQVVDQFRWSTHVELVASFSLKP